MPKIALRAVFWVCLFLVAVGLEAGTLPAPATLTTCEAVSHWRPIKDVAPPPVHLRVVVTYVDPVGRTLFVQDQTGGVFVTWDPNRPLTEAGQLLDLEGVAALVDFAPQVSEPGWQLLGTAPMPEARRATFQEMASALEDSRRVEIEGVVRELAHLHPGDAQNQLWMKLAMDSGEVDLYIPWKDNWPQRLLDAKVRVRGVCGADFNAKNQQVHVQIYVANMGDIKLLVAAPPSDPAPAPIGQLQRFGSPYSLGHRVKVAGTVTAAIPGRGFYLSDSTSGLYVLTREDISLHPGDRVEALGFVELFERHVRLADASVRKTGSGDPPRPFAIKLDETLTGQYDSELVSIEGRVVQSSVWQQRTTLTLEQNHKIFSVSSVPGVAFGELPEAGSLVRITGIVTDEIDSMGRISQASLVCRSAGDIVVLLNAPWWTLKKAWAFLGALAAVALVILIWVSVLRRRVRNQTEVIRQKLVQEETLKEAAQEASRAKSEFLANMSHEIRTPMNAIIGFTELLFETPLNEEQKDFTDTIRMSSTSLMHLLNEILDFSKIEAGQLVLEEVPFSVSEHAQHIVQMITPEIQRKHLLTRVQVNTGDCDRVVGDPHRLQQVILNLLGNSIKFTQDGTVGLTVDCVEREEAGLVLQFTVSDTGIGIPLDAQEKIFEAFQQADGSMTRKYGGTGLGLTICTRLVGLLGGKIWLESAPGQGSKFHFTARFKLAAEQETSEPETESRVFTRQ